MANETNQPGSQQTQPSTQNKSWMVYAGIIIAILLMVILQQCGVFDGIEKQLADKKPAKAAVASTKSAVDENPKVLEEHFQPASDTTAPGHRVKREQSKVLYASQVTEVELCRQGVSAYFADLQAKKKEKAKDAKACTPAPVVVSNAGDKGANSKKLKDALARAKAAEQALENARNARAKDNEQANDRISYLSGQVSILISGKATEDQKAEIKSQTCDDPDTSMIHIYTDTDEGTAVADYYISNTPDNIFNQPLPAYKDSTFVNYPDCVVLSKPFFLVLDMVVDEDEDPNFIIKDDKGNPGMTGYVYITAENKSFNMVELDEKDIKPISFTYNEAGEIKTFTGFDGKPKGYAFLVKFIKKPKK